MSPTRLVWKGGPGGPGGPTLDASGLTPAGLAALTAGERLRLPLLHGNRRIPLAELFDLHEGDPETLVLEGADPAFRDLGADLAAGRLIVEGDAGDHLAARMTGGAIEVSGNAGLWACSAMRGGLVRVRGDVGDLAGAALTGAMAGMAGGFLLVGGSLGARAGDRMRRGVVRAAGGAGAGLGARMIGGTILVDGAVGPLAGYGMRRGSLVLAQPMTPLATFRGDGVHEMGWLRILERELAARDAPLTLPTRRLRVSGCASSGGSGEL